MLKTNRWQTVNKWGETIYIVPFTVRENAVSFARFISSNWSRFSIIGLHRGKTSAWEVSYRPRKQYPWKGGVA